LGTTLAVARITERGYPFNRKRAEGKRHNQAVIALD